jgi:hypothetical protein
MAHTVVSIFENLDQAQKVKQALLGIGFEHDQISIRNASYKTDHLSETQETSAGLLSSVTDFFKDLFGGDDQQIEQYATAAHHGVLISIHTATKEEADKAAAILDNYSEEDPDKVNEDISSPAHSFLDDPLNPVFLKANDPQSSETQSRAARLKSRIVETAAGKGNLRN